MKKMMMYAGILLFAVACEMPPPPETKVAEEVVLAPVVYPYSLKEPYSNWQIGDQQNTVLAMKMIKAWETKNVAECVSYFGDTVEMNFDYYRAKLPLDSVTSFIEGSYQMFPSVEVEMLDFMPVISEDKQDEWVTLWYKQKWVDTKGVADSAIFINDFKFKNGKIVIFSEYVQHAPKK
jgi:hypothetical protein